MGKAIPRAIKIRAEILLKEKPEVFSLDFEKNKLAIDELKLSVSKSRRNLIAGYIVRKLKEKIAESA